MDVRNEMELPEAEIRAHYPQALSALTGFDHAPRLGKAGTPAALPERSPGIPRTTRFRSTTPGLAGRAVATTRPEGIQLIDKAPRGGAEGLNIAFLHPKSTCSVLTELCMPGKK